MNVRHWLRREAAPSTRRRRAHSCLALESLESRVVLYSASGNAWPNPAAITISFMPDGTDLGGATSNLFSSFNAKMGNQWQAQILKAAQAWAQQTNINLVVVPDDGAPSGAGDYQQGDPEFGDIRIGGFNFGSSSLACAYQPPPVNNFSVAGDIEFNTGQTFGINKYYDLFTVAAHEIGHALGLYHSSTTAAEMFSYYNGVKPSLNADDITGIRNIYSGNAPRSQDAYDAQGQGNSFATAVVLDSMIDPTAGTALVNNLDITTTSDVDYYTFAAPSNTSSSFTVNVQSSGFSMLAPKLTIYAADQKTVLATVNGLNQYGTTLSATIPGAVAGTRYYAVVQGADSSPFGTGAYAFALNFGTGSTPAASSPIVAIPNGNPLGLGGGLADGAGDFDTFMDAVPVITGISPDTGLSTNDAVTSSPNLDILGQAPAGSTISVYCNGQLIGTTVAGSVSNQNEGSGPANWQFDNTGTTLPDGMYFFTATATDSQGNVSALSASFTVIVNTQAPAAPAINGVSPNTSTTSTTATNVRTPTLSGTAAPNSQVILSLNAQVVGSTFADSNGAWQYTSGPLSDGTYTFTATDTNLAGNASVVSTPFRLVVATSAPSPVIAGVSRANDSRSRNAPLVIAGTSTAGSTVTVSINGKPVGTATADTSGNWSYSYDPAKPVATGTYNISATEVDLAGNVSAPSRTFTLQVGGKAPTSSAPFLTSGLLGLLTGSGGAASNTPTFIGLATPGSVVTILDGNTILGTTTVGAFGLWTFTSPTLASGKHTLFAEATDASGNTGLLSDGQTITV